MNKPTMILLVLMGFTVVGLFYTAMIYGFENKQDIEINKSNCFEIKTLAIYFDNEPIREIPIEGDVPTTLIPVVINDTWLEIALLPLSEEVCINFSNAKEFKSIQFERKNNE